MYSLKFMRGCKSTHTKKKIKCGVWPAPAVLCKHPAIQHCGFGWCHIVPIKSCFQLRCFSSACGWVRVCQSGRSRNAPLEFLMWERRPRTRPSVLTLFDSEVPGTLITIQKTIYSPYRQAKTCELFPTWHSYFYTLARCSLIRSLNNFKSAWKVFLHVSELSA